MCSLSTATRSRSGTSQGYHLLNLFVRLHVVLYSYLKRQHVFCIGHHNILLIALKPDFDIALVFIMAKNRFNPAYLRPTSRDAIRALMLLFFILFYEPVVFWDLRRRRKVEFSIFVKFCTKFTNFGRYCPNFTKFHYYFSKFFSGAQTFPVLFIFLDAQ